MKDILINIKNRIEDSNSSEFEETLQWILNVVDFEIAAQDVAQKMKVEKTCYICNKRPMCKIHDFVFTKFPIDTNSVDYRSNFDKLYNTLARLCMSWRLEK